MTAVGGSVVSFNCMLGVNCSTQRVRWVHYSPSYVSGEKIWYNGFKCHPSIKLRGVTVEDNPAQGSSVLTISGVRLEDHGIFQCLVFNRKRKMNFRLSVIANRNVSAAVNSSTEFNCSCASTSNITWSWSYVPPRFNNRTCRPLLETPCIKNRRCQTNRETGWSLLSIGKIQRRDAGTYVCSAQTTNQSDYCEMSFNFTVLEYEQSGPDETSTPSVSVPVAPADSTENGPWSTVLAVVGCVACVTLCATVILLVCHFTKSKRHSPTAEMEMSNGANSNVDQQSATISSACLYSEVVPPSQRSQSLASISTSAAAAAAEDDVAVQSAEAETSQYAEVIATKKKDRQRAPPPAERPPPPIYAEITHQQIYFNQI